MPAKRKQKGGFDFGKLLGLKSTKGDFDKALGLAKEYAPKIEAAIKTFKGGKKKTTQKGKGKKIFH